jgi:hypothetical protein
VFFLDGGKQEKKYEYLFFGRNNLNEISIRLSKLDNKRNSNFQSIYVTKKCEQFILSYGSMHSFRREENKKKKIQMFDFRPKQPE